MQQINFMQKSYQNNKIVVDAKGNKVGKNIFYEDQIEFGRLKPGSTFGGRMLVPYKFYHNIKQQFCGHWAVQRKYKSDLTAKEVEKAKG